MAKKKSVSKKKAKLIKSTRSNKTSAVKKSSVKKSSVKKSSAKKLASKTSKTKKSAAKKLVTKKKIKKQSVVKKSGAKKAAIKKSGAKKAAIKKTVAKKSVQKEVSVGSPTPQSNSLQQKNVIPKAGEKKKPKRPKVNLKSGDYVVYPTHGVGQVQGIGEETIAGQELELVVVTFDNERMTLRVPTDKLEASGLRPIVSAKEMEVALSVLTGRARVKRTMWSRRAQEYESKINSGEPGQIAEVLRDLHRNVGQPDQSFSERQIYEVALDRLAAEVAAVDSTDLEQAIEKLSGILGLDSA